MKLNKAIDFETLIDYYENRLDAETTSKVRLQLESDSKGQELIAWIQQFIPKLREGVSMLELQPSAEAVSRVLSLYRERLPVIATNSFPKFIATLIFSSRDQLAPAGARGDQHSSVQQIYSTEDLDIDLWQEPLDDGNWYLIGQVLPKDGEDAVTPQQATLTSSDDLVLYTEFSANEFYVQSLRSGTYEMCLLFENCQIILSDVIIGLQGA